MVFTQWSANWKVEIRGEGLKSTRPLVGGSRQNRGFSKNGGREMGREFGAETILGGGTKFVGGKQKGGAKIGGAKKGINGQHRN